MIAPVSFTVSLSETVCHRIVSFSVYFLAVVYLSLFEEWEIFLIISLFCRIIQKSHIIIQQSPLHLAEMHTVHQGVYMRKRVCLSGHSLLDTTCHLSPLATNF